MSGAELVLACVPQPRRQILDMTGADQVLRVYDTATEAEVDLDGQGDAGLVPQ
ncbi:hypothetical protein ACFPZJ_37575 [Streptomyces bullii]|uniref:Uncharacterized protein n=1 Tax=Streptomyces bullii TaxID=349910 RepID=A0ABW0V3B7_9ACTN